LRKGAEELLLVLRTRRCSRAQSEEETRKHPITDPGTCGTKDARLQHFFEPLLDPPKNENERRTARMRRTKKEKKNYGFLLGGLPDASSRLMGAAYNSPRYETARTLGGGEKRGRPTLPGTSLEHFFKTGTVPRRDLKKKKKGTKGRSQKTLSVPDRRKGTIKGRCLQGIPAHNTTTPSLLFYCVVWRKELAAFFVRSERQARWEKSRSWRVRRGWVGAGGEKEGLLGSLLCGEKKTVKAFSPSWKKKE